MLPVHGAMLIEASHNITFWIKSQIDNQSSQESHLKTDKYYSASARFEVRWIRIRVAKHVAARGHPGHDGNAMKRWDESQPTESPKSAFPWRLEKRITGNSPSALRLLSPLSQSSDLGSTITTDIGHLIVTYAQGSYIHAYLNNLL